MFLSVLHHSAAAALAVIRVVEMLACLWLCQDIEARDLECVDHWLPVGQLLADVAETPREKKCIWTLELREAARCLCIRLSWVHTWAVNHMAGALTSFGFLLLHGCDIAQVLCSGSFAWLRESGMLHAYPVVRMQYHWTHVYNHECFIRCIWSHIGWLAGCCALVLATKCCDFGSIDAAAVIMMGFWSATSCSWLDWPVHGSTCMSHLQLCCTCVLMSISACMPEPRLNLCKQRTLEPPCTEPVATLQCRRPRTEQRTTVRLKHLTRFNRF